MSDFHVLKEYYIRYLRDIRSARKSTVNHYLGALNTNSKYFVEKVEHGKCMYSAGLNNYIRFAKGEEFKNDVR